MAKKILLFIISVLSCFTAASALAEKEFSDGIEANVLEMLDIAEKFDAEKYDQFITREDFAYFVSRMNGFKGESSERYFNDMQKDSYAFSYIGDLVNAGIISGDGQGSFRPLDYLTFNEAAKMLIESLGYGEYAELSGGYPGGYIEVLSRFDVRMGAGTYNLTYAEAIELIYDTLHCYVAEKSPSGLYVELNESDETLLDRVFGIGFGEGTVTDTAYGSIEEDDVVSSGTVKISDTVYGVADDKIAKDYLGNYVKFFYTGDEGEEEIIYMALEDNKEEDLVIDVDDFSGYSDMTVYYTQNNKDKHISVEKDVLIYNGLPLRTDIKNTLSGLNSGKIILRDSDNNSKYDVILITDYTNVYATSIDASAEKIYNKLDNNKAIDLSEASVLSIMSGSKSLKLEDLTGRISLSVAMSKNGKAVEIIVNNNTMSGVLLGVNDDIARIDDDEFKILKSYLDDFSESLKIGASCTVVLDSYGKIVYVTDDSAKWTRGYIITKLVNEDDDTLSLRIISESNEVLILPISKRVVIDGVACKDTASIEKALNDLPNGLIQYKLSNAGEIILLDTLNTNAGEDPEHSYSAIFDTVKSGFYSIDAHRYRHRALFSSNTVTFYIPDNGDITEYVAKKGTYSENEDLTMQVYYSGNKDDFASVAIQKKTDNLESEFTGVIMVEKVSKVINSDGDVVFEVTGYSNGAKTTVTAGSDTDASDLADCEKGDLIVTKKDYLGFDIKKIEKIYDASEDKVLNFAYENDIWTLYLKGWTDYFAMGNNCGGLTYQLSYGAVKRVFSDGIVSVGKSPSGVENERISIPNMNCVIYDSESGEIYIGTYKDILDYKSAGEDCTRIITHLKWQVPQAVYLFK